jgi:hypothetical protein
MLLSTLCVTVSTMVFVIGVGVQILKRLTAVVCIDCVVTPFEVQ